MTLKTYQRIKPVIGAIIAIIFAYSIQQMNFFIPVITFIAAILILLLMRKRVKGIVADERDYETGGKSALLTIQIYSWIAVILMFFLYSQKETNPGYEAVAMTLAFSTCALMLTYGFIFSYYNKMKFSGKRLVYLIAVVIITLIVALFTARVFSGEDSWMCENGQWVQHGHPSYPAPQIECQ